MAEDKEEPQFLGGGPRFNRVGVQPQDTEPAAPVRTAPSFQARSLITVLLVIVLLGVLYWITTGPNGLIHVGGHGGTSPDKRPTAPDSAPGPGAPP